MRKRIILALVVLALVAGAALAVVGDNQLGAYTWNCREATDGGGEYVRCVFKPVLENPRGMVAAPEITRLENGRYVVKIRLENPRCLACPTATMTP